jgi:hypothetical protein
MTATAIEPTAYDRPNDHRSRKAEAAHFMLRAIESFDFTYAGAELAAVGPTREEWTADATASKHNFTTGGAGSPR